MMTVTMVMTMQMKVITWVMMMTNDKEADNDDKDENNENNDNNYDEARSKRHFFKVETCM